MVARGVFRRAVFGRRAAFRKGGLRAVRAARIGPLPSGGAVAQLVERLNGIQEVRGSIPLSSTTRVFSRLN